MRCLFIFAHPDDETVSCAITIKKLTEAGHEVTVVSVTDGGAGEVMRSAQPNLKKFGSVGELRRHELQQVCAFLGVKKLDILNFKDGEITNQEVWGKLTIACQEKIDEYQPDLLVTFDHTGWYFHLDHVAVSIATTLAANQAKHSPQIFFHTLMLVENTKWSYVFPKNLPVTHQVDSSQNREVKIEAMRLHASQDLDTVKRWVEERQPYFELFQLVSATSEGEKMLQNQSIFDKVLE